MHWRAGGPMVELKNFICGVVVKVAASIKKGLIWVSRMF